MLAGGRSGADQVRNALSVCVGSVLPGVFPMMVISGLLLSSGGGELISAVAGRAVSRLFAVSRSAAPAVVLGFLCGFPIGATVATGLYKNGSISRGELARLLTFVNNPGAAFVVYSVGGRMLGSVKLGVMVYMSVVTAAILSGAVVGRMVASHTTGGMPRWADRQSMSAAVVSAVSSAISGSLSLCAFAAFFSATVGVLSDLLSRLGAPFQLRAALFGFFELVGGVSALTEGSSLLLASLSSAAVCSWSGVSVLMQIIAVCRPALGGEKFSFAPMILSKCLQATLSPIILLFLLKLTRFAL